MSGRPRRCCPANIVAPPARWLAHGRPSPFPARCPQQYSEATHAQTHLHRFALRKDRRLFARGGAGRLVFRVRNHRLRLCDDDDAGDGRGADAQLPGDDRQGAAGRRLRDGRCGAGALLHHRPGLRGCRLPDPRRDVRRHPAGGDDDRLPAQQAGNEDRDRSHGAAAHSVRRPKP